jgi:hypothetical protein
MASVVTIGTLLLFGIVFVVLIFIMLSGMSKNRDIKQRVKREADRVNSKYTDKEMADAVKRVNPGKYQNIEVKRSDVVDLATAADYVSREMYVQFRSQKGIGRSGAWVALGVLLLVILCAGLLYIVFAKPEIAYYGYLIGAAACLVVLLMINPNIGGSRIGGVNILYALVCIALLGGAIVLVYVGVREILIFDAASGGTGTVSPNGYRVYNINDSSAEPQIKYW